MDDVQRDAILKSARAWIGTPYRHRESVLGQGTDCLGLIRGVWRDVVGFEPEIPPNYTPDWSEVGRNERLFDAAKRHLVPVDNINISCWGDVVLLRMKADYVAKHLGILATHASGFPTLIHAYSGHCVTETALTLSWRKRIVAQFSFPKRRS